MVYFETFAFEALAPFSLDLSAQVFSRGDLHVRSYANGVFSQVLRVNGTLVLAEVFSMGTVEQPKLAVELKSNKPITAQTVKAAKEAIKYLFSLDFDLNTLYHEVEGDPAMKKITQQLTGFKFPTTPTVFESLVDAIIEQQISIKVARTIEERFTKKFGDKMDINGANYYAFPTPQNVKDACINDIRSCGLSERKAEYIYNAAQLIVGGKLNLEEMKNMSNPEEIIIELYEIKGIGIWTAELTMLRGMQRFDALPADDFGIRRAISTYYNDGKPINAAEAREISKAWGKWKGLAAFYLIIAEVKAIVV